MTIATVAEKLSQKKLGVNSGSPRGDKIAIINAMTVVLGQLNLPAKTFARMFVVLATVLLGTGIFLVCAGRLLSLPAGSAIVADAVVVLSGGGDNDRLLRGWSLVAEGWSSRLVLINPTKQEVAEAKSLLSDTSSLPAILMVDDRLAVNTWQEAMSARRLMTEQGWTRVLVVSDPPHLLRANYAWASVFSGSALRFTFIRTNPIWWSDWHWWLDQRSVLYVRDELLKLGHYVVHYRFGVG